MLHFKKLLNVQQICYKGQTQTWEPEKNEEQKPSAGLSTKTESEESRSTRTTAQQSVDEHIKHLYSLCQHTPVTVCGCIAAATPLAHEFPGQAADWLFAELLQNSLVFHSGLLQRLFNVFD